MIILNKRNFLKKKINNMEVKIKELRTTLDGLTQLTQELGFYTEPIMSSIKSLKLSKMWLGKVLGELGTTNPYPESKAIVTYTVLETFEYFTNIVLEKGLTTNKEDSNGNPLFVLSNGTECSIHRYSNYRDKVSKTSNEKIESPTDTKPIEQAVREGMLFWSELSYIQKIKYIRIEIDKCLIKYKTIVPNGLNIYTYMNPITHIEEAGMWLGYELSRIKEVHPNSSEKIFKIDLPEFLPLAVAKQTKLADEALVKETPTESSIRQSEQVFKLISKNPEDGTVGN